MQAQIEEDHLGPIIIIPSEDDSQSIVYVDSEEALAALIRELYYLAALLGWSLPPIEP